MREIQIKNYRCFRTAQTARIAPLTFLVGENSTGKTSFLALIRPLLVSAGLDGVPNFKEEPYDLGSFDDIVHNGGSDTADLDMFEAGFVATGPPERDAKSGNEVYRIHVTFGKSNNSPVPVGWRLSCGETWIDWRSDPPHGSITMEWGTSRGTWRTEVPGRGSEKFDPDLYLPQYPPRYLIPLLFRGARKDAVRFTPLSNSPSISSEDCEQIEHLAWSRFRYSLEPPYASAPVRSKPRRTYDPSLLTPDPQGDHVPTFLAREYSTDKPRWEDFRKKLEKFGHDAGLFDEISIRQFGDTGRDPFQVQISIVGNGQGGTPRTLADVGYGVSQVLPVVTELLRENRANGAFLLQQPEVHLHPRAQAALGDLFCIVAAQDRQIFVETHSDYLLDRVRMIIRDGNVLKPEDVSVLFFERAGTDVNIHSIGFDEDGNVVGAPEGYRRFFLDEVERSIGL